jgi:alpha-galactosidase
MINVAKIGAGSVVFSKTLTGDLLSFPEFRDATFTYMDIDQERLDVGAALCRKIAKGMGANPTIKATLDQREALKDADFVIVFVQVGGFDNTLTDFEIPRKYGLRFTIADTTGPGGLMRALRSYPFYRDLARDAQELCPNAYILNYTNPMSMNMLSLTRNGHDRSVGLCHSVQGTFNQLMGYLGEKPDDVAFACAGINHMAFYTRIAKGDVDLYPRLFEAMDKPEVYKTNKVRFELMRRLGHYVTESSEHNAEYSPWFLPHGQAFVERYDVPIDEYLRRCDGIVDEFARMKVLAASEDAMAHNVSLEYGSQIVHSIATGTPRVVYGNMPNSAGQLASLPKTAIVELPTLVDRSGLKHVAVGELPPQLIGYMFPHVTQHELFIRAAMEGRRDHLYQAAMYDPLTAATVPPDKIVEMIDELIAGHGFEGEGGFLPKLDAKKSLVPTSGKQFSPPTPQALRASWDAAQRQASADALCNWQVIGPFTSPTPDVVPIDTGFEIEATIARGGAVAFAPSYASKSWTHASPCQRGLIDARAALALKDASPRDVVFATADVESVHARDAVLKVGSDGCLKVWLNGRVVHSHAGQKRAMPNVDVPVHLEAGTNRLVVKACAGAKGWRWGVLVPRATF